MSENSTFVDYYEVLGIWPTADATAVKKAYFRLAKIHHPDVVGNDDKSHAVFKMINEAFDVLSNNLKRRQYDEKLKTKSGPDEDKLESDRRSANLAFEQARAAMKIGRYDKAVVLLKSAIGYDDNNASYHSYYGFALGALKTHLHEARDACKKALEMEFYNADYHANLGFVYHQAGLTSTADESFQEALKWDPDHPVATKYYSRSPKGSSGGGKGLGGLFSFFRKSDEPAKKGKKGPPKKAKKR